jgi:aspartate aminotransferase-like enzyme
LQCSDNFILDQLIYPGKTTVTDCFRIGNIGRLFETDMKLLGECIKQVCNEMNINLPLKNAA